MGRRTALKASVLAAAAVTATTLTPVPRASADDGRWSPERAGRWYQDQDWLVGANYIAGNAVNQLEMFQPGTFDPLRIDAELRLARLAGMNAVRVFLHDLLWIQDPTGFLRRVGHVVDIAARNDIRPLFVLFDSCWDPLPALGKQAAPRPGIHNSRWVQSPGAENLDDRRYKRVLHDYVVGVLTRFRGDRRILGWDLWNEPDNPAKQYRATERADKVALVADLLPQVFRWARSVGTIHPLTSGVWDGPWADSRLRSEIASIQLDQSDVVSFHSYDNPAGFDSRISELAFTGRPLLCTEYMARSLDCTVENILPITKRRNVGAFAWGLVAGKTQTYYPWDSWERPYTAEPTPWFHDLLTRDGAPYRPAEIATIRNLTGRPRPS
ncbi:cellulase family glycosylhydrolase [Mycolicibacterium sp. 3033]|nr:cellulase family glycosylhydrolase [Mycolicibacterium aurantiacum]